VSREVGGGDRSGGGEEEGERRVVTSPLANTGLSFTYDSWPIPSAGNMATSPAIFGRPFTRVDGLDRR
jgi:hypothetical protein